MGVASVVAGVETEIGDEDVELLLVVVAEYVVVVVGGGGGGRKVHETKAGGGLVKFLAAHCARLEWRRAETEAV